MELPLISSGEHTSPLTDEEAAQHLPLLPRLAKRGLRGPLSPLNDLLTSAEDRIKSYYRENKETVNTVLFIIVAISWLIYVVAACIINLRQSQDLLIFTGFVGFCLLYWSLKRKCGSYVTTRIFDPAKQLVTDRQSVIVNRVIVCSFVTSILIWVIIDSIKEPQRLISLVGLTVFPFIAYLFSRHRAEIKWRPVVWGFIIQFLLGLLTLRTSFGYHIFKWICDVVIVFLGFSSKGGEFFFGNYLPHQGMLLIIPILVYVSAFTYCMYYLGLLQVPASKIAWGLRMLLGTSSTETLNAVLNVFVGQVEAPVFIRPFLNGMTKSELHAVMAAGFSTISGSLFAVYISFGISAEHLLSAAVMSAPASLAMSKLIYPEIEESETKDVEDIEIEDTGEKNVFEAIAVGATLAINLLANIAVILIAFVSLLACVDGVLGWLGSKVGVPQLSFEFICSYILMPFAFIMGVPWKDSFKVAELLGVKTFLNEMVAYRRLSAVVKDKTEGVHLSPRAVMIATYALCGFANFGSMGMQLAGLSALAPTKRTVLPRLVVSALIAGSFASFMTASMSGLLVGSEQLSVLSYRLNTTGSPTT